MSAGDCWRRYRRHDGKGCFNVKKALLRLINTRHENNAYAQMECEMLHRINNLGIGPQGLGGIITALAVNIEDYPTHIAGSPVVVNLSCHAARHAEAVI